MFDRFDAIRARLAAPLLIALAIGVAWFALESLVYRSGAYFHFAEPDSNTGSVVRALLVLEREYRPGARNVLVLGDSRVAEGFSPAHARTTAPDLNFINMAVPGSTPRTWYYLLREVDRRGHAYEGVVVGTLYRHRNSEPIADWPIDPAHAARLVGLRDAASFPASFDSDPMRERARHAALLPALALRQDTLAFLESPRERLHDVLKVRPLYLDALRAYQGRDETMPELRFDETGQVVADWGTTTPAQRVHVMAILGDLAPRPPALRARNEAYLERWLGNIASLAQRRGARLILYSLPRGPYRALLDDDSGLPPSLASLDRRANVAVLPPGLLADLESPQHFFDQLHANRAGREATSARVAAATRDSLQAPPR